MADVGYSVPRRRWLRSLAGVGVALIAVFALASAFAVAQGAGGAATNRSADRRVSAGRQATLREARVAARAARVAIDAALVERARLENERKLRDAQVAQYFAAVAEYYRPKTGVNWDGVAQCETASNWSMQGSKFSGGLGFYNGTWTGFGGREFAPNAGQATREEQIIVAERVYARHRLSGWGCRAYG